MSNSYRMEYSNVRSLPARSQPISMANRDIRHPHAPVNAFEAALCVNTELNPCMTVRKKSCIEGLHDPDKHRVKPQPTDEIEPNKLSPIRLDNPDKDKVPLPTMEPAASPDGPKESNSPRSPFDFGQFIKTTPDPSPEGLPISHRSSQSTQHRRPSDEDNAALVLTGMSRQSPADLEHRTLPRPDDSIKYGHLSTSPVRPSSPSQVVATSTTRDGWPTQFQSTGVQHHVFAPVPLSYSRLKSGGFLGNQVPYNSQRQVFPRPKLPQHAPAYTGPSQVAALVTDSRKRKRSASTSSSDTVEDTTATPASRPGRKTICTFCHPPCGETANFRSVISQFFGRNKNVTKLIPNHLIRWQCRKSYQRFKYAKDKEGVWYIQQAEKLQELFIKLGEWYNELNTAQGNMFHSLTWTVQMTKGVREKPAENPIDNAIQQGLTARGLIGQNISTNHVLRAIVVLRNTIVPAILSNPPRKDGMISEVQRKEFDQWLKAPNLGGIECLPTGLEKAKQDGMQGIQIREKPEMD